MAAKMKGLFHHLICGLKNGVDPVGRKLSLPGQVISKVRVNNVGRFVQSHFHIGNHGKLIPLNLYKLNRILRLGTGLRDYGDDCCANQADGEWATCEFGYYPSHQPQSYDNCPNYTCLPGDHRYSGVEFRSPDCSGAPVQTWHVPSLPFDEASAFLMTYGTSHHALVHRAELKPGETLLVLGAAGGVGLAAVEIGKAMGARVVAAASSDEKLAVAKAHGADVLVNYGQAPTDRASSKALAESMCRGACAVSLLDLSDNKLEVTGAAIIARYISSDTRLRSLKCVNLHKAPARYQLTGHLWAISVVFVARHHPLLDAMFMAVAPFPYSELRISRAFLLQSEFSSSSEPSSAFLMSFFFMTTQPVLVTVVTFSVYSAAGNTLDASVILPAMSLFALMRLPPPRAMWRPRRSRRSSTWTRRRACCAGRWVCCRAASCGRRTTSCYTCATLS